MALIITWQTVIMSLIIIDKKIPEEAKIKLSGYGDLLELETIGITYDAISGHPDIFFSVLNNDLIVAPNLPQKFREALKKHSLEVFYANPDGIILPGFKNGFIGGCTGISGNQLFLIGSLHHYSLGDKLRKQINAWGYEVVELYNGPVFDGGSVLFL